MPQNRDDRARIGSQGGEHARRQRITFDDFKCKSISDEHRTTPPCSLNEPPCSFRNDGRNVRGDEPVQLPNVGRHCVSFDRSVHATPSPVTGRANGTFGTFGTVVFSDKIGPRLARIGSFGAFGPPIRVLIR